MNSRRGLYWAIFLGAAGLVALIPEYFFAGDDELAVQATDPASRLQKPSVVAQQGEQSGAGSGAKSASASVPQADLFAVRSWRVVPQFKPMAVAPVAPVVYRPSAPPLPFHFIGKLEDHSRLQVFLQEGEQVHVVRVGDVIGGTYKVQRITQEQMTLLYLPLKISQSLAVGSTL